ncbi:recombinase family protein [Streptomyces sp. NPDC020141]|uniref:recombinase family protein n=1 Tax=Streptomyces sp. NPDC020141 TaxID=3365065 RepID=UPI0037A929C5
MRVFTYRRISRVTERTTSIERQGEHCAAECSRRGWTIVDDFKDEGVSGATDPEDRPGMSKMLARLDEVDAIVFYKLDRLSRSTLAFAELMERCKAAGVALVSCTEPLDLSSPMGIAMAEIIAVFAKLERGMIRERSMDARRKLREDRKFVGGRFPYGLKPAPHPSGKGRVLVRDEFAVAVIRRMGALVSGDFTGVGHSATAVAKLLNADGVPTSRQQGATAKRASGHTAKDTYWRGNAVRAILRNPIQLGHNMLPNGRAETGGDGLPLVVWEQVFTWEEWEAVQSALNTLEAAPRTQRYDAHWLQRITRCGVCDGRLTQTVAHGRASLRCARPNEDRHTPSPYIRIADLDEWVNESMMTVYGHMRVVESVWHPGSNNRQERLAVASAIRVMRADRDAGLYRGTADEAEYRSKMAALMARRDVLEAVPDSEPRWETRDTGRTFAEVWERSTLVQRAGYLADAGLVIRVDPAGGKRPPVGERARIEPEDPEALERAAHIADEPAELPVRSLPALTDGQHEEIQRDRLDDIATQEDL